MLLAATVRIQHVCLIVALLVCMNGTEVSKYAVKLNEWAISIFLTYTGWKTSQQETTDAMMSRSTHSFMYLLTFLWCKVSMVSSRAQESRRYRHILLKEVRAAEGLGVKSLRCVSWDMGPACGCEGRSIPGMIAVCHPCSEGKSEGVGPCAASELISDMTQKTKKQRTSGRYASM